jgi:hypothetical protein
MVSNTESNPFPIFGIIEETIQSELHSIPSILMRDKSVIILIDFFYKRIRLVHTVLTSESIVYQNIFVIQHISAIISRSTHYYAF